MKLDCQMNGISLAALDERILITDIEEEGAPQTLTVCDLPGREGSRFIRRRRTTLTVKIRLVIRERSIPRRRILLEKLARWCTDGYLTLSDRRGQRLGCVCVQGVEGVSVTGWAEEITLIFRAYGLPWWEDAVPKTLTLATGEEGSLRVGGTAETTWAEAEAACLTAVDTLTLTCGDTAMTFTGLAMTPGETLCVTWDREGLQRISIQGDNSRSALGNRTADSADDLLLPIGKTVPLRVEADGQVSVTFRARGRY
ncbi:MAG: hypothetical protein Q4B32_11165 [Clostridia bacterium]|nr:hypothetical protein [Clostridia bacterium]